MSKSFQSKVLFISGSYPPIRCGIGFYMAQLSRHLAQPHKIVTSSDIPRTEVVAPVVRQWSVVGLKDLVRYVRQQTPDIIHIQYSSVRYGKKLGITLLPRILKKKFRTTPLVITVHEYHDASLLGRLRVRALIRAADRLIVSNKEDQLMLERFKPGRISLIPIGSNIEFAKFSLGQLKELDARFNPGKKPLILTWGLVDEAKGLDNLVEALKSLDKPARLIIASDCDPSNQYHQQLLELISRSQIDVLWTGFLPDDEISGLLQLTDLVVLPYAQPVSLRRGSLLAALSHGKAVITTGPSQDELLQDRSNCLLLNSNSPSKIAAALNELLSHPKLARLLGEQARHTAAYFDWNKIAQAHDQLYEELLAKT